MSYIVCPTCNRLIADKMIPYEEGLKKISDNPNLSSEQKDNEKIKLMDNLKIPKDRYCCRMRLMCYRDLVRIVK
jgi:DNA-directed RNA polymerase subunit N (RpoN/RPB10)